MITETKPATLGSSVTLHCTLPVSNFLVWEKTGTTVAIRGVLRGIYANSTRLVMNTQNQRQSLTFNTLTLSDDGQYKCNDLNDASRADIFQINILGKIW